MDSTSAVESNVPVGLLGDGRNTMVAWAVSAVQDTKIWPLPLEILMVSNLVLPNGLNDFRAVNVERGQPRDIDNLGAGELSKKAGRNLITQVRTKMLSYLYMPNVGVDITIDFGPTTRIKTSRRSSEPEPATMQSALMSWKVARA